MHHRRQLSPSAERHQSGVEYAVVCFEKLLNLGSPLYGKPRKKKLVVSRHCSLNTDGIKALAIVIVSRVGSVGQLRLPHGDGYSIK